MNGYERFQWEFILNVKYRFGKLADMTKSENHPLRKGQKHRQINEISYRNSILSHLNILDLEDSDDSLDEYDC